MAAAYNDGTVPYGAPALILGCVCETINIDRPTTTIQRRNELNEPSGQIIIKDFFSGSATLQKALSGTAAPTVGTTFSFDGATCIVTSVGQPQAQGDAMKFTINFTATAAST